MSLEERLCTLLDEWAKKTGLMVCPPQHDGKISRRADPFSRADVAKLSEAHIFDCLRRFVTAKVKADVAVSGRGHGHGNQHHQSDGGVGIIRVNHVRDRIRRLRATADEVARFVRGGGVGRGGRGMHNGGRGGGASHEKGNRFESISTEGSGDNGSARGAPAQEMDMLMKLTKAQTAAARLHAELFAAECAVRRAPLLPPRPRARSQVRTCQYCASLNQLIASCLIHSSRDCSYETSLTVFPILGSGPVSALAEIIVRLPCKS